MEILQHLTERVLLLELEGQLREQYGETFAVKKSHISTAYEHAAFAKQLCPNIYFQELN